MSKESGEAIELLAYHTRELREADNKYLAERMDHLKDIVDSNDRRYAEVNVEKEKALKIKETADAEALRLARESQAYKDQQTDKLRDETLGKSGVYATNAAVQQALKELEDTIFRALKPLTDFVARTQGASTATHDLNARQLAVMTVVTGIVVATLHFLGFK